MTAAYDRPTAHETAPVVDVEQLAAAMHDTYWGPSWHFTNDDHISEDERGWWRGLADALVSGEIAATDAGVLGYHAASAEAVHPLMYDFADEHDSRRSAVLAAVELLSAAESSRSVSSPVESGPGTGEVGAGAGAVPAPTSPQASAPAGSSRAEEPSAITTPAGVDGDGDRTPRGPVPTDPRRITPTAEQRAAAEAEIVDSLQRRGLDHTYAHLVGRLEHMFDCAARDGAMDPWRIQQAVALLDALRNARTKPAPVEVSPEGGETR